MLTNHPTDVDTYLLPTDAAAAKSRIIALIGAATTKIRMGVNAMQDPDIIQAIADKFTGGLTDLKIAIDWYTAHLQWEHYSLSVLRTVITPARAVYSVDPTTHAQLTMNIATFDDATTIDGSTEWTTNAWRSPNRMLVITDATLATANSASIDTLIAWNLTHMPQII